MTASPACLSRQVGDFLPPAEGVPGWLPAAPAISFAFCPLSPRPLSRRGRGRPKVYFAGGFAPGTPALNRLRHLQTPPEQVHGGGLTFFVACLPCL